MVATIRNTLTELITLAAEALRTTDHWTDRDILFGPNDQSVAHIRAMRSKIVHVTGVDPGGQLSLSEPVWPNDYVCGLHNEVARLKSKLQDIEP